MNSDNSNTILAAISLVGSIQFLRFIYNASASPSTLNSQKRHPRKLTPFKPPNSNFFRGININGWTETDYKVFEREMALLLLTISGTPPIQEQASKVLISQTATKENLDLLIKLTKLNHNSSLKTKAIAILSMISEQPKYSKILFQNGMTQVLVRKLGNDFAIDDLETQTYASTTLCNIFSNLSGSPFDTCASIAIANGLIPKLNQIIKNNSIYNYEILNNMIDIAYNFSIQEKLSSALFSGDVATGIMYLLRDFTRDVKITRKLIETLVRTTTQSDAPQTVKKENLEVLVQMDIITILNAMLYSEDQSIVSWSIGMIHELVIQSVGLDQFVKIQGFVKLLCHHLSISKVNYANGLILRILWYLQSEKSNQNLVRSELTEPSVFIRIISLFGLHDHETCYWIVSFLSGLSVDADIHPWIISSSIFSSVLALLEQENNFNSQIRILISIVISHLFDSKVVSANLKKIEPLIELFQFLIDSGTPEVTLNLSSAVVNLKILNPSSVSSFYSPNLQERLFEIILDKNLDRLHLHAAKNVASLISRGLLDFPTSSSKAAVPFLQGFVSEVNSLLVWIINDLDLCHDDLEQRNQLKLTHDKPRKLTKAISRCLCSTESLSVISTFYDELSPPSNNPAQSSVDFNKYDPTLLQVVHILVNLSGTMLGILNVKFLLNYSKNNSPDYETISKLHAIIKNCTGFYESNEESESSNPLHPFILITDYLRNSSIRSITDILYKEYLHSESSLAIRKDIILSNFSYTELTRSWSSKLSLNGSEQPISEWLRNLHLTTEITLLHTAVSALSSLFSISLNKDKFSLVPQLSNLVVLLTECPFLSRGCELKLMQSLPIEQIRQTELDTLMNICLRYSKLQYPIPPASTFLPGQSVISSSYNRFQSRVEKYTINTTSSSLDSSFIFESLLDSAISASVHVILQINKPYSSHFYSKDITILLANSVLEQFISANQISLVSQKPNSILFKPANLPSLDSIISSCGWPVKQSSFPSYKNIKTSPLSIISNSKVFNDSWEFMSVTSILPTTSFNGCYSFSVLLLSAGLMQIGWCTDMCEFYPVCGKGVGDNFESLAYDGYRKKRWYGNSSSNEYGEKWKVGDIISSTINLKLGTVEFFINGVSMGIAFGPGAVSGKSGLNSIPYGQKWYPAVSLTSCQALQFLPFTLDPAVPSYVSKYEKIPYPLFKSSYTVLGGKMSHIRFLYNSHLKQYVDYSLLPFIYCKVPKTRDYIILALLPAINTTDELYTRSTNSAKLPQTHRWYFIVLEEAENNMGIEMARQSAFLIYDSALENHEQFRTSQLDQNGHPPNISFIPYSQLYCFENIDELSAEWISFDLDFSKTKINLIIESQVVVEGRLSNRDQGKTSDKCIQEQPSSPLTLQQPFLWHSENIFSFQVIH